jgi:RNA polymerase sigma-70 factor (ECF subfamily)
MAIQTDQELLALYQETGELSVFAHLFTRYSALTYGVCLKYLKDREEAKDMVMQVFEKLTVSLRQNSIVNFKSWLYVTTRNHCLMHLRAQKNKFHQSVDSVGMENELTLHLEVESDLEQNLVLLEKCIEELSEEQKTCVQLFYIKEMSYKEIAQTTRYDLLKVKSHIQNGKRNLKICLEKNG